MVVLYFFILLLLLIMIGAIIYALFYILPPKKMTPNNIYINDLKIIRVSINKNHKTLTNSNRISFPKRRRTKVITTIKINIQ